MRRYALNYHMVCHQYQAPRDIFCARHTGHAGPCALCVSVVDSTVRTKALAAIVTRMLMTQLAVGIPIQAQEREPPPRAMRE